MNMKYFLILLFVISNNASSKEDFIEKIYRSNNVVGSIVIESDDGEYNYNYNFEDKESFIPASTFKIPNTLIILEEGLIKNVSETIPWDGVERGYAPWNQDQNLKTAFQFSCVWCYQRYAKKLGKEKYLEYLKKLSYGNQLIGSEISRFWLDGDLRVSLKDQVSFIRKVYSEKLPIQKKHIKTLKRIMLSEEKDQVRIFSKTGWSGKDGWYVGYLVINEKAWFFANHIEIKQKSDLRLRKSIVIDVFKTLKVIK